MPVDESWVDLPSSGSLSDEIITTGLLVQRRRRSAPAMRFNVPADLTSSSSGEEEDDEFTPQRSDDGTVLGERAPRPPFRPAPNPFHNSTGNLRRRPMSYQDNDAALRSSLNTLLWCARGLAPPADKTDCQPAPAQPRDSMPVALSLVRESDLNQPAHSSKDEDSQGSPMFGDRHSTRPKRRRSRPPETVTSMTPLTTLAVGAGVVVLVSAVGFGAGYVVGREMRVDGRG